MAKGKVNIILFGAPGAGKGTQAVRLADRFGLTHISTGQVIRDEIAQGTELGKSMDGYISRGELAPDGLVVDMVADFVAKHKETAGNIFDGFPRTLVQAKEFDRIMAKNGVEVDGMICLIIPDEVSVQRLLLRGLESCRADDFSEEVIRNRIAVYHKMTEVVAEHYEAQGKLYKVDGSGTIEEIFERLSELIEKFK